MTQVHVQDKALGAVQSAWTTRIRREQIIPMAELELIHHKKYHLDGHGNNAASTESTSG